MNASLLPPVRGTIRSSRGGFSIVELIVAMTVFAIVIAGTAVVLTSQQQFHRDTASIMEVRNQLRQAAGALPFDLRSISTVGSDLVVLSDSAVAFRSTFGRSIACVLTTTGTIKVMVPPPTLASGNVLTNWLEIPVVGDTVGIFDEGATAAASDDTWLFRPISAVTATVGGCPSSTGYTTSADASSTSYNFSMTGSMPSTVKVGAAVRFVRRVRYALYRAADSKWYLGYCTGSCASTARTAIAGPLRAYAASGASGASFSYLTAAGAATTVGANVARIQILLRAASSVPINLQGTPHTFTDSLRVTVGIRNR
jgi:prepilin-type N-terminal cleavage/methylation domain-containing protein